MLWIKEYTECLSGRNVLYFRKIIRKRLNEKTILKSEGMSHGETANSISGRGNSKYKDL